MAWPFPSSVFFTIAHHQSPEGSGSVSLAACTVCPSHSFTPSLLPHSLPVSHSLPLSSLLPSPRVWGCALQGPTSSGKTSLVEYLAQCTGHTFVRISNHEHTDLQEYLGAYVTSKTGKLVFQVRGPRSSLGRPWRLSSSRCITCVSSDSDSDV